MSKHYGFAGALILYIDVHKMLFLRMVSGRPRWEPASVGLPTHREV